MAKNKEEIDEVTIGASMLKLKGGRLARKITDETLQVKLIQIKKFLDLGRNRLFMG